MNELLISLGVNLASSAVYDLLKSALDTTITREQLVERIASQLNITNATIVADRIIDLQLKMVTLQLVKPQFTLLTA